MLFLLWWWCYFGGSFFFSSRRRHTRWTGDWSSDVCSSDLTGAKLRTAMPRRRGTGRSAVGLQPAPAAHVADRIGAHQSVPYEQHQQRTDDRADDARALINPIPADGLAEIGRHERADDAEHRSQNETVGIVGPRRQNPRDDARDESNQDDPQDVHRISPRSAVDAGRRAKAYRLRECLPILARSLDAIPAPSGSSRKERLIRVTTASQALASRSGYWRKTQRMSPRRRCGKLQRL